MFKYILSTSPSVSKILSVPFPYNNAHMLSNIKAHSQREELHFNLNTSNKTSFIKQLTPYCQSPCATQIALTFYHAYCLHHNIEHTN